MSGENCGNCRNCRYARNTHPIMRKVILKGEIKMNNIIKAKMEKYVIEKLEDLEKLDTTQSGYQTEELHTVKVISTLVETLQKEDINENSCKVNLEKIKNDVRKIDCEREIAMTKIETEVEKNDKCLTVENKKVDNSYDLEVKKLENEITKINLDKSKIDNDREINEKKINCDVVKNKQELMKINNDYEINIQKIQVETEKNDSNNVLESKKLKHVVNNDNNNFKLKVKEFDLNKTINDNLNVERIIKVLINGAEVIIPAIIYNMWMKRGFEFEETGTYTSNTFKNIIGKFKPTK